MVRRALVIAAAVLAGAVGPPASHAQPAPELSRARDLYASAEAAMKDGRFEDAARDYGAAYELSKDPALFFKIGRAQERAGKCDVALVYYARYLRDGHPTEQFTASTRDRITACGGDPHHPDAGSAAPAQPGSGATSGSAGAAAPGAGSAAPIAGGAAPSAGSAAPPAGSAAPSAGNGTPTDAAAAPAPLATPTIRHKIAWVMTGSAIALTSLGGILAFAARSSENDLRDLYLGFGGQAPAFDARTRKSYDDLVSQGQRYEHLSWAAFGVAGAATLGAVLLFVTGGRAPDAERARITPVVTPGTAGVSVRF
jgi:hypothetical protein